MEGKSKQGSSRHPDLSSIPLILLHKAGRAADETAWGQAQPCPGTAELGGSTCGQDLAFPREKAACQLGQPRNARLTGQGDPASELVKKEGVLTTTEGKKRSWSCLRAQ